MVVDVRQRQYAIGLRGSSSSLLTTENIWTCAGFAGVDERNGVVFLCHLDTPICAFALPKLIADLRKHVSDLSGFKLYTLTGLSPGAILSLGLLFGFLVAELCGRSAGLAAVVGVFLMLNSTGLYLKYQLWRLGAFSTSPRHLGHSSAWQGFGKCGIRVDADGGPTPEAYSYGRVRDHDRFKEPDASVFRMTKAENSA